MALSLSLPMVAVTVFEDQARVERSGPLPAAPYPEEFTITGLPLSLLESSVQVRVEGAPLEVAEVRFGWSLEAPSADDRTALERTLEEARFAAKGLQERLSSVQEELNYWASLTPVTFDPAEVPMTGPDSKLEVEAAQGPATAAAGVVLSRAEALQNESLEVASLLKTAFERVQTLETDLRNASSARAQGRVTRQINLRCIPVRLEGEEGEGRISLSYLVPGARWIPAYRVRFDPERLEAELSIRAVVAQKTGEDWRGVRLSLSTASGQYTTELPQLASMRIGRRQPAPLKTGWRPPPEGLRELFADYMNVFPSAPPPPLRMPSALPSGEPAPAPSDKPMRQREERISNESADLAANLLDDVVACASAPPPAPPMAKARMMARASVPPPAPLPGASMAMAPAPQASFGAPPSRGGGSPEMAKSKKMGPSDDFGAYPDEAPALQSATELEAGEQWLRFDHLRLSGPGSAQQGTLRVLPLMESLREHLGEAAPHAQKRLEQTRQDGQGVAALPLPPHARLVRESRGQFDHRYDASLPIELPSDGRFHTLTLVQGRGAATLEYVCVPREEQAVYRELCLVNPLSSPLLAGPAELYIGADLVATSPLSTVDAGGQLRLGLGIEERIKVARNTKFKESAPSLLGRQTLEHEITVELASRLDRPVVIQVLERIPLTEDSELDIKEVLEGLKPVPYKQTERGAPVRGGRQFTVSLEARGRSAFTYGYRIQLASKLELVGGNRRE